MTTVDFAICEVLANSEQAWLACKDFEPYKRWPGPYNMVFTLRQNGYPDRKVRLP